MPPAWKSKGVVPVAILGTHGFDVSEVDPASIQLAGVSPIRSALEDVAAPFEPFTEKQSCTDCTDLGPDGFLDLTFTCDTQTIVQAIVGTVGPIQDGDCLSLSLTAELFDGTPITGEDVVVILTKGKN